MAIKLQIPTNLKEVGSLFKRKALPVSQYTNRTLTLPTSTQIITGTPIWRNLTELIYLLNCYYDNPIVQAVINIKAKAFSNIKFYVKDLQSGEIIPIEDYDDDNGTLHNLLRQPNPLQNTSEWLCQLKINHEVFGNSYAYGSVPVGYEDIFTHEDIVALNNLPPYCMSSVLTGKWLDATKKEEIISKYIFSYFNGKTKEMHPNTVLHLNKSNIRFDQDFTSGKSPLIALKHPISNIDKAYESRNVLIYKRGALGILSSELKDDVMGSLPMDDDQIEKVQKAFEKYGLLQDQYSQIISPMPMKYTQMAQSTKELMLFEEIESDAIAVCNAYGVPERLLPYYIQKGGLSSDNNVHEKRLYDSTIIPEAKDFMIGLNNFLNTKELGIEIIGSYDHLNVLQEDKKFEAECTQINANVAEKAFRSGAINYNSYLAAMGLPQDDTIGDLRIWDLSKEQLQAINNVNSRNDLNNDTNS